MSLTFTGTGGLLTRLGRIGKLFYLANTYQAGCSAATDSLFDQFDGDDRILTPVALAQSLSFSSDVVNSYGVLSDMAQQTILRAVRLDQPARAGSLGDAIAEIIRQMNAGSVTVKRATVSATATALTNVGNGVLVTTTTRGDGLPLENITAETIRILCTQDSYDAQVTAGAEPFDVVGSVDVAPTIYDYDWPRGSACLSGLTAVYPDRIASDGTLLANGDFETWTVADTPDNWTIAVGTAGTQVQQSTATFYAGLSSLKLPQNATLASLTQTVTLLPQTAYAFAVWIKADSAPSAGVFKIELIDGTGAVTADTQSTSNVVTVNFGSISTTWTAFTGVFRLGRTVPSGLAVRIRKTTDTDSGNALYIDNFSLTPMLAPYAGGPGFALFGGATAFATGDGWNVVMANNRGGSTYGASFQTLFDRVADMKGLGLVLPSAASPSVSDTLITS